MIVNILAETAWERSRLGKITSSRVDCLWAKPVNKEERARGELGRGAKRYIYEKAAEIVTGRFDHVGCWQFDWGTEYEPVAAERLIEQYPTMEYMGKANQQFFEYTRYSGGSPDAASFETLEVAELKCPARVANHIAYCMLKEGADLKKLNRKNYHQLQMNMACVAKRLGVKFEDMHGVFGSYCPLVTSGYKDFATVEIAPDMQFYDELQQKLEQAELFLADVLEVMGKDGEHKILAA